ncbi:MAG: hypothetical protein ACO3HT_09130, partial [Ilumatobacteraceae bacterium]
MFQTSPVDHVVRDNHPRGTGRLADQLAGPGPTCAPFLGDNFENVISIGIAGSGDAHGSCLRLD